MVGSWELYQNNVQRQQQKQQILKAEMRVPWQQ